MGGRSARRGREELTPRERERRGKLQARPRRDDGVSSPSPRVARVRCVRPGGREGRRWTRGRAKREHERKETERTAPGGPRKKGVTLRGRASADRFRDSKSARDRRLVKDPRRGELFLRSSARSGESDLCAPHLFMSIPV